MLISAASDVADEQGRLLGPLLVQRRRRAAVTAEFVEMLSQRRLFMIAFANTHLLYCALRDPQLAERLRRFCILNDGIGVALLARLLGGRGFPENLNGTDLTPHLLASAPAGVRVMMVGTRRNTIERAARRAAQQWPHLEICACRDGYGEAEGALDELAMLAPDVVLVGMGNPRQERWIARAAERHASAVYIGVGAWFDFFAQDIRRAPPAWRRLRLEWAFRLLQEPRRLWRRYTIEILVVVAALLFARGRTV